MSANQEDRWFATHHGVISRAEALRLCLDRSQISRRLSTGRWKQIHPGVYRHGAVPMTWELRGRAGALAADGLISHRAAARVWRIDGFERARTEFVVAEDAYRHVDGLRIHRSRQMGLAGRSVRHGLPVTGVDRTVLDVAAVVSDHRLGRTVDAVLRQRLTTWPRLLAVLVRHSARGRDGCGRLRLLLDDRFGEAVPDSPWNRMVGDLLTDAALPKPVFEYVVTDQNGFVARVDLAYPEIRLAIECDSRAFHDNGKSFIDDRRRWNRLTNAGWTTLSFTWSDFVDRPDELIDTVAEARRRLLAISARTDAKNATPRANFGGR